MMKLNFPMMSAAALALAACSGPAPDSNPAAAEVDAAGNLEAPAKIEATAAAPTASNGRQYVELVGGSDRYEIESARLALDKTQNADVRALAQMILDDHQRSSRELVAAARQAQPPLQVAPEMTAGQQAQIETLRAASAEGFDEEYLTQQVRAHEHAMSLVTSYAASGDVASLRQHAATVAVPIQQHLSRARELVEQAAQPPQE